MVWQLRIETDKDRALRECSGSNAPNGVVETGAARIQPSGT